MSDWRRYVEDHLPALRVSPERESEIVGELALQLEQAHSEAIEAGLTEAEAMARVERQIPDWTRFAGDVNDAERPASNPDTFTGTFADIRHAFRFLRRNPLLAAIAIATLAFGIGANTAIFTIVDAIALRSLPYNDPDRLMAIETKRTSQPELEPWASALDFFDFRERNHSFASLAGISPLWNVVMTGRGEARRLEALYVSAEFFPMLGVRPEWGRLFTAAEDNRTHPGNVVMLSDAFWQREFGSAHDVLGKVIALDSGSYTIIGVLPRDFRYLGEPLAGTASNVDVWIPLADNPLIATVRGLRFLKVIGRLKLGVTAIQANEESSRLGAALASQYPSTNDGYAVSAQPLETQVAGQSRTTLFLLLGAVGFVLLMACANVAHLLLARAASRQTDLAVRVALGASRYRLIRHLLSEGAVLALIGAVLGVLLARVLLKFLIAAGPAALLQTRTIDLDVRALLFTASAAILSAILSGLPPAWRVVRSEIGTSLRQGGRSLSGGSHRLRAALVVAQVALASVLLVGAGLLIHSFVRLLNVNPGFNAEQVLTFSTQVPMTAQSPEQRTAVYRGLRDELLTLPGVKDVAAVSRLPLLGMSLGAWLHKETPLRKGEQPPEIEFRAATPNYFATMGIPLRRGRIFDDHDLQNPVVVIDEAAAARFWPGEDPIGRRIKLGADVSKSPWSTIVGVVGSVRHSGISVDPQPHSYRPYSNNPLYSPIVVVRTSGNPAMLINTITSRLRASHPELPVYNVFAMDALVDRSNAQRRFVMLVLTGFAAAALLLALVGIYGTVAQSVAQRSHELGLRMALGASPGAAVRLIVGEGARLVAVGLLIGLFASIGLTRLMRGMLFEVSPLDPAVLVGAALTIAFFAMAACYLPANRATRVDPVVALRAE